MSDGGSPEYLDEIQDHILKCEEFLAHEHDQFRADDQSVDSNRVQVDRNRRVVKQSAHPQIQTKRTANEVEGPSDDRSSHSLEERILAQIQGSGDRNIFFAAELQAQAPFTELSSISPKSGSSFVDGGSASETPQVSSKASETEDAVEGAQLSAKEQYIRDMIESIKRGKQSKLDRTQHGNALNMSAQERADLVDSLIEERKNRTQPGSAAKGSENKQHNAQTQSAQKREHAEAKSKLKILKKKMRPNRAATGKSRKKTSKQARQSVHHRGRKTARQRATDVPHRKESKSTQSASRTRRLHAQPETDAEACTFHPKTTKYESSKLDHRPPLEQRISAWLKEPSEREEKLQKAKKEQEKKKLASCTFHPSTRHARQDRKEPDVKELTERLYTSANDRLVQRQRAKALRDKAELKKLKRKPQINKQSARLVKNRPSRPIHQRVGDILKEREARLHYKRLSSAMADPDLTFAPQINPTSRHLGEDGAKKEDIVTRMTNETHARLQKQIQLQAIRIQEQSEFTFSPHINQTSKRILEDRDVPATFLSRQAFYHEKQKQSQLEREKKQQASFKPKIGNADKVLANSNRAPIYENESVEERVARLSHHDSVKKQQHIQRLAAAEMSKHEFKPKLSKKSQMLMEGRRPDVDALSKNVRGNDKKRMARSKADEEFSKKHTFKPTLAPGTRQMDIPDDSKYRVNLSQPSSILERIAQNQQAKERKLAEMKRQIEEEELRGCSFEPEFCRPVAQPAGPVPVRGLNRFLEFKELAKRKDQLQQQREEEVFMQKLPEGPRTMTIPQPFNLSFDQNKQHRKESATKLREDVESYEMRNCTFHPKTLASSRKAMIKRLLDNDDDVLTFDLAM